MNSLLICLFAALSAATANLFFRKSAASSKTDQSNGYLVVFYFLSFLFSLVIFPDLWKTPINYTMLVIGAMAGVFNITLMLLTAQALQKGPSGLTFAFQNASSIFPAVILYFLFGPAFGYMITFSQFVGIFFVLLGLYLGTRSTEGKVSLPWLKYALACFVVQILALSFIQGRCVLFHCEGMDHILSPLALEQSADVWFMPGQFGTAFILQLMITLYKKEPIQRPQIIFGSLGGVTNGLATFLLLMATKYALPHEQALLLPCFSVATIILCNLWANRLYQEKFNFAANACCAVGILIGSLI